MSLTIKYTNYGVLYGAKIQVVFWKVLIKVQSIYGLQYNDLRDCSGGRIHIWMAKYELVSMAAVC